MIPYQSPMSGSLYSARPGEPGQPFGEFTGQRILGQACTIRVTPAEDGALPFQDMIGCPMRRGRAAIHISGVDPFGKKTGPGFVRELGWYEEDYLGRKDHPSGLGSNGKAPAALVTWDGVHQRQEEWAHHAFWGACNGYVTLDGVYGLVGPGKTFHPRDICLALERRTGRSDWYNTRQHVSAIRRLLEGMVGVSNVAAGAIVPGPSRPLWGCVLARIGRWQYFWPEIQP